MKKVLLMAAVAFVFAACGNSNSNKEADCCGTKATEHVCKHGEGHECTKAEGEHKCNHAADSTKHECNNAQGEHKCNHENGECNQPADKQCDKCKEAAAKKAAEQAQ